MYLLRVAEGLWISSLLSSQTETDKKTWNNPPPLFDRSNKYFIRFDTWRYFSLLTQSCSELLESFFFFFMCGVSFWERNENRSFRACSLYKPNWLKLIHTWAELHLTECLPKQTDGNSYSQYFVGKWPLNFAVYWKWFTLKGRDVCKVHFNQNPLNKIQSLKRLEEASCLQNDIL